MKNEFWTSAFRFNSVRNWWFQPYLVLNRSISCVVLIQPCACNVLSNNSLKHLERHETAVREECSNCFPLKMDRDSGTLPESEGCNFRYSVSM